MTGAARFPVMHGGHHARTINTRILLTLLPGIAVSLMFLGYGVLLNILVANVCALALEAIASVLRGHKLADSLDDRSALLSATLLALALPAASPWWLLAAASVFSVLIARHAFGGGGQAPFNPAMAGYLFVLLAWPDQFSYTVSAANGLSMAALQQALSDTLGMTVSPTDGLAMATPLAHSAMLPAAPLLEAWQGQGLLFASNTANQWINLAFLGGGIVLLITRTVRWPIPLAMLTGMALMTWLFAGATAIVPQLLNGATMLAAFFIATDAGSAAITRRGRLLFGLLTGCAVIAVRFWGQYPDGVAVAILFANFCAPLLDLLARPRILGHAASHDRETAA